MTPSPRLLEVQGLVKAYRGRRVVDGVSFHVDQGEIVGLLGPNGAGKTTSFRMTVGLTRPDAGCVFLGSDEVVRTNAARSTRAARHASGSSRCPMLGWTNWPRSLQSISNLSQHAIVCKALADLP